MEDYPTIFNNKNFSNIKSTINNLEITNSILEKDLKKAWFMIKSMPLSPKKMKYLVALILPNNFIKRFI